MKRVIEHYNEREQSTPRDTIRLVNNWVKRILISSCVENVPEKFSVLDLAGGRGGDLTKWYHAGANHITLIDASDKEVERARERWESGSTRRVPQARFEVENCFPLQKDHGQFHIVSCQFALQHAFGSSLQLRETLCRIRDSLYTKGWFLVTVPDADRILADTKHVTFEKDCPRPKECFVTGVQYTFNLPGSIDHCPEYIVPPSLLISEALSAGLGLVQTCTFDQFCHEKTNYDEKARFLWNFDVDKDSWSTISLYRVFIFRKQ